MTNQPGEPPWDVLRDGSLKATIWHNEGENGVYFTTTLSKTFEQNGKLRDGQSFSGADLLRIAELARQAYKAIRQHRQASRSGSREAGEVPAPSSP